MNVPAASTRGSAERIPIGCNTRSRRNRRTASPAPTSRPRIGRHDVRGARRVVEVVPGSWTRAGRASAYAATSSWPAPNSISMTLRHAGVHVVLGPLEPVAHLQEVVERDGGATVRPARHPRRRVERQPSLPHQHADAGVQHRLGHRPRQQGRVRLDGLRRPVEVRQRTAVAVEEQPSSLHDRDRVRGAVAIGVLDSSSTSATTAAGGSAVGHASVGQGTPAGWGGSGSRGSSGSTGAP